MTSRWARGMSVALTAGAGALAMTPALPPRDPARSAAVQLTDWVADIMAGTGMPIATQPVMDGFTEWFIDPALQARGLLPAGATVAQDALYTPEEFYGATGVRSLTFDQSVAQGVTILHNTIEQQLDDGNNVVVFGHSQGAAIASQEMQYLAGLPDGERPDPTQLAFVLTGDPNNPNGGILERFAGLSLPSMGISFSGATPVDTPYPTDIYTLEYDGFADFPKYPLNVLADLNAGAGILFVHGTYPDLTSGDMASASDLGTFGNITYHMIPTENLPLLDPVRIIPVLGKPIADLLQPDLKVLVDLGYGADGLGYSLPANVPTGFGLFPDVNVSTVLGNLVNGAEQGVHDFVGDLENLSLPDPGGAGGAGLDLPAVAPASFSPGEAITEIARIVSGLASGAYSTLLPTADLVNAFLTSVPAYDLSLFMDGMQDFAGNPIGLLDAIGDPIAADLGLAMLGGGWEAMSVVGAFSDALASLVG